MVAGGRRTGLTAREADRAAVVEKRLRQREAADRLGLGVRQAKWHRAHESAGMASARLRSIF